MKRVVVLVVVAVVIVPAVIVVVMVVIVLFRPGFVGSDRAGMGMHVGVGMRIVSMVVQVERIIDGSEDGVSLARVVMDLGLGVVVMVAERRHELDCQSGKSNPRKPTLSPHLAQTRLPTKTSSDEP